MTYLEGSMPSQDDRDYEESIYSMNPPINPTNSFFSNINFRNISQIAINSYSDNSITNLYERGQSTTTNTRVILTQSTR